MSVSKNESIISENVELKETATTKKRTRAKALADSDEIIVKSLVPHVSYKDSKNNDFYEWDEVGHEEYMTVGDIKNMWRNHKGYFKNLWLKPMDDRIISQFGLTKLYNQYEFLMDDSHYTPKEIDKICDIITKTPNSLKASIYNKIKDLVEKGELRDLKVIKTLEKCLNIELVDLV